MSNPRLISQLVLSLRQALGQNAKICLALTTSNEDNDFEAFMGGCRIYQDLAIISVVNLGQHLLSLLIPTLKELDFSLILVDTDKKHPFEISDSNLFMSNLVSELRLAEFTNIVPFSSTKMTADSVVNKLIDIYGYNLSGMTVAIVGLGSIGFQVALDLVRQGVNINAHSKDHCKSRQLVDTINLLKSEYTLASVSYFQNRITAFASSTVLIDCSSAKNLYHDTEASHLARLSEIITVSKRSFTPQMLAKISNFVNIVRTDVSPEIVNLALSNLSSVRSQFYPACKITSKNRLISGGYKGVPGDIVVDSAENPTMVLGQVKDDYKILPIYKSFSEWSNE